MKRIRFICILVAIHFTVSAQQPQPQLISWKLLKDVTWSEKYMPDLKGYYQMPAFGSQVEFLDNRPITIQGFYVPVDVDGKIFALSETPSYMCFFCGTGGIESVMEISVKQGHHDLRHVRTDRFIQIKGTLMINRGDPEHLMYILKDAELVKVIR